MSAIFARAGCSWSYAGWTLCLAGGGNSDIPTRGLKSRRSSSELTTRNWYALRESNSPKPGYRPGAFARQPSAHEMVGRCGFDPLPKGQVLRTRCRSHRLSLPDKLELHKWYTLRDSNPSTSAFYARRLYRLGQACIEQFGIRRRTRTDTAGGLEPVPPADWARRTWCARQASNLQKPRFKRSMSTDCITRTDGRPCGC